MPIFDVDAVVKRRSVIKSKIRGKATFAYGTFSKYNKRCGIYSITCIITNKIYIGASKNVGARIIKHFSELRYNRHTNAKLQHDFNVYGTDKFIVELITTCDSKSLSSKERDIQIEVGIENLYNNKITNYYMDANLKERLAKSDKSSHKTKEYRTKMSAMKSNLIAQYNYDMELIKVWSSSKVLCAETGHTRSVILSCCNGSKKRAYGYLWRYVDENLNIVTNGYLKARKCKN